MRVDRGRSAVQASERYLRYSGSLARGPGGKNENITNVMPIYKGLT